MSALEQTVPDGYKQTEIGIIPKGWRVSSLSNCLENERIPSGLYKDKNLYGSGTSIIKLGDVFGNDFFKPEKAQKVAATKNEISAYKVKIGDLIIALASVKLEGVGKVMLVDQLKSETIFDHNVALIRFKSNFNPTFMSYMLRSHWVRSLIASRATQVGTTFLKTSTILEFEVPLPDISEQTAIANALSDVDALLTKLEKLLAKKQAIKTATMQQLLTGKTRLPQFATYTEEEWQARHKHSSGTNVNVGACGDGSQSGGMDSRRKGTKPSELGEIPEDWEITKVKNVASVIDSLHKTPSFSEAGFSMVRVADIKTGNLNLEKTLKVNKSVFEDFTRNYIPKKGDIVLSRVGSYGVSSYVETDEPFCIGQNTVVINSKISSKYLYYILNSPSTRTQIEDGSYGSGYKSLSLRYINELKLPLPIEEEQTAIATILSDMDSEIQTLEQRLAKTRQIKQGMMQELLTGHTRLPFNKDKEA
ncbi:restriction endonuclease subunit S [uncultured Pseudoalteromonas sp.]|uniref:restriction endonuclease subunit S n=1 Tax=uncultured Pseudoalteromonas sp. TaxID=114053 RepID=UPI0032B190FC